MKLVEIETFLWVARLGSFRAAARRLGTTQPCVSSRIRELEDDLGVELFDRTSRRKIAMTAKGRALVPHAERLLRSSADIRRRFSASHSLHGVVRLGVTGTIAVNWLPKLIDRLSHESPGIELRFVADLSANLANLLVEGGLDLAFFAGSVPGPQFAGEVVGRVPLAWFASPSLGVPNVSMTPEELAAWPIITDAQGTFFHRLIGTWFAMAGVEPLHHHACSSLATRIQLAEAGVGIAVIPLTALTDELETERLRMVEVQPPLPDLEHVIAYPALGMEEPAKRVVEIIKQQLVFEPNFRLSAVAAPQYSRSRAVGDDGPAKSQRIENAGAAPSSGDHAGGRGIRARTPTACSPTSRSTRRRR